MKALVLALVSAVGVVLACGTANADPCDEYATWGTGASQMQASAVIGCGPSWLVITEYYSSPNPVVQWFANDATGYTQVWSIDQNGIGAVVSNDKSGSTTGVYGLSYVMVGFDAASNGYLGGVVGPCTADTQCSQAQAGVY